MDPASFHYIADFLKKRAGISIGEDKVYLVESRLLSFVKRYNLNDFSGLVAALEKEDNESLRDEVLDAMTTNETLFFRDSKPFEGFRGTIIPDLMKKRQSRKSLRIWCAAASTGQEPYSIGMLLMEERAKLAGWNVSILGTDISRSSLKRAKEGVYSQFEVQRGMPMTMLVKYFHKQDNYWAINPELRDMVDYRELNLLDDYKHLGQFDIVFCRNVLIYFDLETKQKILAGIRRQMADDGILVLGSAETVIRVTDHFKLIPDLKGFYTVNTETA